MRFSFHRHIESEISPIPISPTYLIMCMHNSDATSNNTSTHSTRISLNPTSYNKDFNTVTINYIIMNMSTHYLRLNSTTTEGRFYLNNVRESLPLFGGISCVCGVSWYWCLVTWLCFFWLEISFLVLFWEFYSRKYSYYYLCCHVRTYTTSHQ